MLLPNKGKCVKRLRGLPLSFTQKLAGSFQRKGETLKLMLINALEILSKLTIFPLFFFFFFFIMFRSNGNHASTNKLHSDK